MRRLLHRLLGRTAIILAAVVLQIVLVLSLFLGLSNYFGVFQIVMYVIGALVTVNLINRDSNPDTKIPWLVVVLLLPVFGTVLYLMFSRNRTSIRETRRQERVRQRCRDVLREEERRHKDTAALAKEYRGQSSYLNHTGMSYLYGNTDTEYYPDGESFFEALLEALRSAEHFIFMEYFIVEAGYMWDRVHEVLRDRAAAGVEIHFMYDDFGCSGVAPRRFAQTLRDEGIHVVCFHRFTPLVSAVHNNRDHRKITVVDGRVGFCGGINIGDNYINRTHPFGHWKDSAVRLTGDGVTNLSLMFLELYCMEGRLEFDFGKYLSPHRPGNTFEGLVQPFCDGPCPFNSDAVAENAYLNLINQAQSYIYITTPYLIIDFPLRNALESAAKRGVDVRIVTPHIPDKKMVFYVTRGGYSSLIRAGVRIFEYTPGFIHAKNVLCDGVVGVVGSINFDYRSLIHHYECGVWMYRTRALEQLRADFDGLWECCEEQTEESARQSLPRRVLCRLMALFTPLL